jgi:DNA-binding LacI/PurR family transcriptional regulator
MVASTLKDVAARAGVSIKTVSNVVNDYPYVALGRF